MKNEVIFEPYLDLKNNVKTKVAETKMRISCHLLPIESAPFVIDPKLVMNSIGDEMYPLISFSYKGHLLGEPR